MRLAYGSHWFMIEHSSDTIIHVNIHIDINMYIHNNINVHIGIHNVTDMNINIHNTQHIHINMHITQIISILIDNSKSTIETISKLYYIVSP